jgi:Ras-related GTP-binding protein C/D
MANPNTTTQKPCIMIMGLPRSGKSSIRSVVFQRLPPNETLLLESTHREHTPLTFLDFTIVDCTFRVIPDPGTIGTEVMPTEGALVFVIDAQDDYIEALQRLYALVVTRNPKLSIEIFIHKVDGLSDDVYLRLTQHKIDTQREIHARLMEEFNEAGMGHLSLSFHLTSIYDHSIYEAFSKVIQKLMPTLPTLENLLNMLCSVYMT